jgi:hypothetical protein
LLSEANLVYFAKELGIRRAAGWDGSFPENGKPLAENVFAQIGKGHQLALVKPDALTIRTAVDFDAAIIDFHKMGSVVNSGHRIAHAARRCS